MAAAVQAINDTTIGTASVVSGVVYVAGDTGNLYAIDAGSGCVFWSFLAEAGVRARLPPGMTPASDFLGCIWEVSTLARQKLLLLEAISLSPFLSWGIVVANGALQLLRVVEVLAAGVATFGDLDGAKLSRCASYGKPVRGREGAPQ